MSKLRTIKGRKFLKQVDDTLKCGNRMPVLFPVSGKGMTFIEGHQSPTGGFDEYVFRNGDEWLYFHSTKDTSLTTKKGLNSTQLHLNHVRRIQVD